MRYEKRKSSVAISLLAFVLVVLLLDVAGNSAQESEAISLNQATNLAISNSPEIRQISWLIDQKLSDGFQQSRLVNPQIGTVINEAGNDGQAGQYGFFIQRNIVRNDRVQQIQNAYQLQARSLEVLHQIRQRKLAKTMAMLFIDIQYRNQQLALAHQKREELERIRKIVKSLVSGGELSPLDLNRLDVKIELTSQLVDVAKSEIDGAVEMLKTHIGDDGNVHLDFDFEKEVQMVLNSSFQRDIPLEEHPAVKEIDYKVEAQRWMLQLAQSKQRPDWQVQSSINYDFASDDAFGGFQLNIPWQINDRKQGLIASESAELQILDENRKLAILRLQRKLIELNRDRKTLVSKIRSIQDKVLPKVDETARVTANLFHSGETDVKSVEMAVMESFDWRERSLELSRDLLVIEADTETLLID